MFLRTNWTPLKQYRSYGEEDLEMCLNCNSEIGNTRHIFFECPTATKMRRHLDSILLECLPQHRQFSETQVLFHNNVSNDMVYSSLVALKYATQRMQMDVIQMPIHDRVIKAFLRKNLLLLCNTNIKLMKDQQVWLNLRNKVYKHLLSGFQQNWRNRRY